MLRKSIKLENLSKSETTINLKNFNNRVYTVKGNGFAMLDEDELSYLVNTSKVFERGTLKIANADELSGIIDTTELQSSNALSDTDIVTLLGKSQRTFTAAVDEIDNLQVLQRILAKAKELDKPIKTIETIEAKITCLHEQ